jgi:hypothetical protein
MAYALFNALGIKTPTSSGRFTDAGPYLDGVTSTLADLGITQGIGGDQFGTTRGLTRGEAFTLVARALKLVPPGTDIGTASQALVDAGIVKGYGNDPSNLGLDQPLQRNHMQLVLERVAPMWDQPPAGSDDPHAPSIRNTIASDADQIRMEGTAAADPTFAAYLQAAGVRRGQIDDEMRIRTDLFGQDTGRREEVYGRRQDEAEKGINTDWENRGLFRSGARGRTVQDSDLRIGEAQRHEQTRAQEAYEMTKRDLTNQQQQVTADTAIQEAQARMREAEYNTGQKYS